MQLIDNSEPQILSDEHPGTQVHWLDRIANIYETESGPSRIVPMEGLRGWAVLLVFFVHSRSAFKGYVSPGSPLFYLSDFLGTVGGTGVDLFFVISGYLIYGAVIRPRFTYGRFLRRRVERIYPAFLAVFLLFVLMWLFSNNEHFKFRGTPGETVLYLVQNLLLMPGIFRVRVMNDVTWSLSYEMFFYLLLPCLVAVTGMRRLSRTARVSWFVALGSLGILISPLVAHPRVRLVGFLFGIVLFEGVERFRRRSTNFRDLAAVGAYMCGLSLIYAIDMINVRPEQIVPSLTTAIAGVSSFAFCGLCFHGGGILSRLFTWRPLRCLGNMSYSFYLIHGLAMGVVRQSILRIIDPGDHSLIFVGLVLAGFVGSWVAATLLFVAVEKPLSIRIKPRIVAPASPI